MIQAINKDHRIQQLEEGVRVVLRTLATEQEAIVDVVWAEGPVHETLYDFCAGLIGDGEVPEPRNRELLPAVDIATAWNAIRFHGQKVRGGASVTDLLMAVDTFGTLCEERGRERERAAVVECETCKGQGTIDETLTGEPHANPEATCPDCEGSGERMAPGEFLKQHAIEELCQLGYKVEGIRLIPPDHLPQLMAAAGVTMNWHGHQMAKGQPQGATPGVTPGTEAGGRASLAAQVLREIRDWDTRGDSLQERYDEINGADSFAAAIAAAEAKAVPEPPRRLSPFDAVAEAMRLASLMGGSIGMSDVEKTKHYEQRLRSHLVEFIYPPEVSAAAPTPAAEAPGWMPIETAPKDRKLLLWGRYWNDRDYFQNPLIGQWNPHSELQRWESPGEFRFGVRPTHWMPMPAAPQPTKDQQG